MFVLDKVFSVETCDDFMMHVLAIQSSSRKQRVNSLSQIIQIWQYMVRIRKPLQRTPQMQGSTDYINLGVHLVYYGQF